MNRTLQSFFYGTPEAITEEHGATWSKTALMGRVFISAIFVFSGISKFMAWSSNLAYAEAQGVPYTEVLLAAAAAIEVIAGLCILTGAFVRAASLALFLYLIPVTLLFHNFWDLQGAERQMQMAHFMKNLSIMGGLLILLGQGAARHSLDAHVRKRLTR